MNRKLKGNVLAIKVYPYNCCPERQKQEVRKYIVYLKVH